MVARLWRKLLYQHALDPIVEVAQAGDLAAGLAPAAAALGDGIVVRGHNVVDAGDVLWACGGGGC